jgi:hypothetical protein
VDLREPDYDSLSAQERAALDEWRAGQIPAELELVNRFIRDVRKHGKMGQGLPGQRLFHRRGPGSAVEDYTGLLHKCAHTAQDAPSGNCCCRYRG